MSRDTETEEYICFLTEYKNADLEALTDRLRRLNDYLKEANENQEYNQILISVLGKYNRVPPVDVFLKTLIDETSQQIATTHSQNIPYSLRPSPLSSSSDNTSMPELPRNSSIPPIASLPLTQPDPNTQASQSSQAKRKRKRTKRKKTSSKKTTRPTKRKKTNTPKSTKISLDSLKKKLEQMPAHVIQKNLTLRIEKAILEKSKINEGTYTCQPCKKVKKPSSTKDPSFNLPNKFKLHIKHKHTKPFKCEHCSTGAVAQGEANRIQKNQKCRVNEKGHNMMPHTLTIEEIIDLFKQFNFDLNSIINEMQPPTPEEQKLLELLEQMSPSDINGLIESLKEQIKFKKRDPNGSYNCCTLAFSDVQFTRHFFTVHIKPFKCLYCELQCNHLNMTQAKQKTCTGDNNPTGKHHMTKYPQTYVDLIKEFKLDINPIINEIQQQNNISTANSQDIQLDSTNLMETNSENEPQSMEIDSLPEIAGKNALGSLFEEGHWYALMNDISAELLNTHEIQSPNPPPHDNQQSTIDSPGNLDKNFGPESTEISPDSLKKLQQMPAEVIKEKLIPGIEKAILEKSKINEGTYTCQPCKKDKKPSSTRDPSFKLNGFKQHIKRKHTKPFKCEHCPTGAPQEAHAKHIEKEQNCKVTKKRHKMRPYTLTIQEIIVLFKQFNFDMNSIIQKIEQQNQPPTLEEQKLLELLKKMSYSNIKDLIATLKDKIKKKKRNRSGPYSCCDLSFFSDAQFIAHIRDHIKPFRCEYCKKGFNQQTAAAAEQKTCTERNNPTGKHKKTNNLPETLVNLIKEFELDINPIINEIQQQNNISTANSQDIQPENNQTQPMETDLPPEIAQGEDNLDSLLADKPWDPFSNNDDDQSES